MRKEMAARWIAPAAPEKPQPAWNQKNLPIGQDAVPYESTGEETIPLFRTGQLSFHLLQQI